jgi:hypothetical protein
MLQKIGLMIVFIGAMMADSETMLAPIGVIGIGMFLIYLGMEAGGSNE